MNIEEEEFQRRRGLSAEEEQREIEALISTCAEERGVALALAGYETLESLAAISDFHWLEDLDCSFTSVSDLESVAGLHALKRLDCRNTPIADIAPLENLTGLTWLSIVNADIADLGPVAGLHELAHLDCWGTSISDLGPIRKMTKLAWFDCSHTLISDLAPLSNLMELKYLDCSGTSISSVKALANLRSLEELHLRFNRVSDLTPLGNLLALTRLYCSGTRIADLTPLSRLAQLVQLDCSHTSIADLEPLSDLTSLTHLSCVDTPISDLGSLVGLNRLVRLNCRATQIFDLTPLQGLSALEYIDCSYTKVSDLDPLSKLHALTDLSCTGTQVSSLGPLVGLSQLRFLNCWDTQISDLAPLAGLDMLAHLDCSHSKVTDIGPLSSSRSLTHLDCSGLILDMLPDALLNSDQLEELIAVKARIGRIPGEELSKGYGDNCLPNIRAYFDDLAKGAAPLERSKIIILGNGQVGKTQLRRWLLDSDETPLPFDDKIPSTHGIEVMRGALKLPSGDEPLDASIWDFGGQDIYHGTHSLFMKTRAIFVICWCPQQEDNREQELDGLIHQNRPMAYWIDYVRQLAGPDNPLIIVQTQCDSAVDKQRRRFADLDLEGFDSHDFAYVSARNNSGGAALREAIGQAAQWIKDRHGVPLIGAGRLHILNRIEAWRSEDAQRAPGARQHKFMSQDAFAALCDETGGISSQAHLLSFLHHAGVIFYRAGLFDDRIILDQDWALNAIYAVFNRDNCYRTIRRANGRFRREDLADKVWQGYGIDEQRLFLSMMESCGIVFTHYGVGGSDDYEYIAPELLPPRGALDLQIERGWHGGEVAEARLRYGLLHHGLIRQILSRIGRDARIFGEYWQTGVLFYERERQSDAMIEAVADVEGWGGEIIISCRNGRAKELLPLLVEEVEKIGRSIGVSPEGKSDLAEAVPERHDGDAPEPPDLRFGSHPSVQGSWYVSYAWGDATPEGIERDQKVDSLCAAAEARGVRIVRDRDTIGNGDSIRRFMETLIEGDRIIAILSDKYLHSPNCMYELFHAWQKQQANQDLFGKAVRTYRLPCAKFSRLPERGAIAQHWDKQVQDTKPYLDSLGSGDLRDYQLTKQFALNVGDILRAINDTIGPRDWDEFLDWAFGP